MQKYTISKGEDSAIVFLNDNKIVVEATSESFKQKVESLLIPFEIRAGGMINGAGVNVTKEITKNDGKFYFEGINPKLIDNFKKEDMKIEWNFQINRFGY